MVPPSEYVNQNGGISKVSHWVKLKANLKPVQGVGIFRDLQSLGDLLSRLTARSDISHGQGRRDTEGRDEHIAAFRVLDDVEKVEAEGRVAIGQLGLLVAYC